MRSRVNTGSRRTNSDSTVDTTTMLTSTTASSTHRPYPAAPSGTSHTRLAMATKANAGSMRGSTCEKNP